MTPARPAWRRACAEVRAGDLREFGEAVAEGRDGAFAVGVDVGGAARDLVPVAGVEEGEAAGGAAAVDADEGALGCLDHGASLPREGCGRPEAGGFPWREALRMLHSGISGPGIVHLQHWFTSVCDRHGHGF